MKFLINVLSKLSWFFPKSIVFRKLKNNASRNALHTEIQYINIIRLRSMLYVIVAFVFILLLLDLFTEELWSDRILKRYLFFDSFMFLYMLVVLFYIRRKSPINKEKMNSNIHLLFKLTLYITMVWAALISANEMESYNGLPSFVITCFAISTFFLLDSWFMLLLLSSGIYILVFYGSHLGKGIYSTFALYLPSFFLVFISYFISRVLYNNYVKAFAANFKLNETNTHLDELVQQRTKELSAINSKLEHEINERLNYESNLRNEKQKAEEADRLKSAFLANMSHEIRTPLNGIVGFSDLLGRNKLPEEKRNRYVSIIKTNSNQLIHIINDIIDISMIESDQLKFKYDNVRVKHIYEKATNFYESQEIKINNKVAFNTNLVNIDDNLEICTDVNRVIQVIYNLLGNAFKFTEKGYVKFIMRRDDNNIFICVEDTGIGVPKEKANIIFERFRQIENSPYKRFGGTGLGLSISKGIIQQLNGEIWLDCYYKVGARFCFSIPITISVPKPQVGLDLLYIKTSTTNNKKILLFIEDINFLEYIRQIFSTEQIILCNKLTKALDDLSKTRFDLVIYATVNDKKTDMNNLLRIKELFKPKTALFSIAKNDQEIKTLKELGSRKVFLLPLNLLKFIVDINTQLKNHQEEKQLFR